MTITLFLISLSGLAILVLSKIFEIKVRKIKFLTSLFERGDVRIHEIIDVLIFQYNRSKIIARIFFLDFLPSYTYELLVKMKDYVSKKYYSAGNDFRGRRVLRSDGSVSFFLKRITEDTVDTQSRKV